MKRVAFVPAAAVCLNAALGVILFGAALSAQAWTPDFEPRANIDIVPVGQTFTVDYFVKNVQEPTKGYQSDIIYNSAEVQLLSIVQGPYLQFQTFFGSTVVVGRARIGALNFPVPTSIPPGPGFGVLATATFRALQAGAITLDMRQPTILVSVTAQSIKGTTKDIVVYGQGVGDILAVHGQPNPGGTLTMTVTDAASAGRTIISSASFGNSGIPIGRVGTIPLNFDPLVWLAVLNVPPYSNSVTQLNASGVGTSTIRATSSTAVIGIRLYFASVVLDAQNKVTKISNGASVQFLIP